jgi:hypothetical protein
VRPVGAGRAVELAEELGVLDARELALEPPGQHGELLAHRRRVAGCPWVWASSGTSRRSEAIVASASTSAVARGSQTSVTAPLTITAYDRLLTSSLVHAKWMSSARPRSASSGAIWVSRFFTKYSTAFTSCWVTRSVAAISSISAAPNVRTISRRLSISDAVSRRTPGTTSRSVRWINHSTSTCTRARFRAGSLRWSTRGATAPR